MRLVLAAAMVSVSFAQPVYDCGADLVGRANRFAMDYNAYTKLLVEGKVNRKMAARVEGEFKALTHCECWK